MNPLLVLMAVLFKVGCIMQYIYEKARNKNIDVTLVLEGGNIHIPQD